MDFLIFESLMMHFNNLVPSAFVCFFDFDPEPNSWTHCWTFVLV